MFSVRGYGSGDQVHIGKPAGLKRVGAGQTCLFDELARCGVIERAPGRKA